MIEINAITLLLFIFSVIYLFSAAYLISRHHPNPRINRKPIKIAVLIAVRNEENHLGDCLKSLENQQYEKDLYDVIILDDESQDTSPSIAKEFCERNSNFHFKNIKKQRNNLSGKMNVLAQGLSELECDLVLITDADCIAPASWINTITSYFDNKTGLVGALTSLSPPNGIIPSYKNKFFQKIQTLDWFFLQSVARYSSNAGKPVTVLGNNFAFSLKAYREVGGFETIGFSITEDYALLKAIEKTGHWEIKHINDAGAIIFSYPLNTLREFFQQRMRWIKGGKSARPWGYFLMTTSFITHTLILLSLISGQFNIFNLVSILMVFLIDYQTIKNDIKKSKLNSLKPYFILFELFYILYTIFFSVYYLFPIKINWKGRDL